MKIGILGCGVISHTYVREMKRIYGRMLEIGAVADERRESAEALAAEYGIPEVLAPEELLRDDSIRLIVNLTPPKAHAELNRRILEAGKHVFCEKPLALTVEEAQELARLAGQKGLYIGSAPDTFLAAPMQSCRKLLEEGWIGKPLYVTANMMSSGVETWHPSPRAFYEKGGGPLYDMAGYYLSALIHFFGPVEEVFSYSGKGFEKRRIYSQPLAGEMVRVDVPTHYASVLKMKNGILVNMNMSFDIWYSTLPKMEIYGTEGTLTLPDPNMSDGKAAVFRKEQVIAGAYGIRGDQKSYELPLRDQNVAEYTRGTGVAEMVRAIESGRKNRAGAELAIHVLEVIQGMMESSESGACYKMRTACEQPPLWNWLEAY